MLKASLLVLLTICHQGGKRARNGSTLGKVNITIVLDEKLPKCFKASKCTLSQNL